MTSDLDKKTIEFIHVLDSKWEKFHFNSLFPFQELEVSKELEKLKEVPAVKKNTSMEFKELTKMVNIDTQNEELDSMDSSMSFQPNFLNDFSEAKKQKLRAILFWYVKFLDKTKNYYKWFYIAYKYIQVRSNNNDLIYNVVKRFVQNNDERHIDTLINKHKKHDNTILDDAFSILYETLNKYDDQTTINTIKHISDKVTNYVKKKENKARAAAEKKAEAARAKEERERIMAAARVARVAAAAERATKKAAKTTRAAEARAEATATARATERATARAAKTTKEVALTTRTEEETKPRNIFSTIRRTIRGLLPGNKKDIQVKVGGTKRKKRRPKRRTCKQSNY